MKNIPAFPVVQECGENDPDLNGMTLRDYFAAKVMQGIYAGGNLHKSDTDEKIAIAAYEQADAMLRARES